MWARRCGAPRRWPSRIKVLIFTVLDGGIGLSIYLYMAGSNISYLDLAKPPTGQVLCLTEWPETGLVASWSDPKEWFKWWTNSDDHEKILNENMCTVPSLNGTACSNSMAPITDMARPIASAMQGKFENLRFDVLGMAARVFLTLAIFIWVGMAVHDLALIGNNKKNFILDVTGVNKHCPVIRQVWKCLAGHRVLFQIFMADKIAVRVLGGIIAILLAPVIIAWNVVVFNFVIAPIILMAFARYPVRMCRAWVFIVCVATFLYGIALSCLMFAFAGLAPQQRPHYAVTWMADSNKGSKCTCGCDFPVSFGVCMNLAIIGIGTALKALFVALRCLKGLRRSQWANLLSVVFPVPLTVYTVDWRQSNRQPIKFRDEKIAVQEEVAFDPFAMMDEQLDSAYTTVNLEPAKAINQTRTPSGAIKFSPSRKNIEAPGISQKQLDAMVQIVDVEYIGCCGFPWPTGGRMGLYTDAILEAEDSDEDENGRPHGQRRVEKPPQDPEPDGRGASSSRFPPDGSVPQPKESNTKENGQQDSSKGDESPVDQNPVHFWIKAPDQQQPTSGDANEEQPHHPKPDGRVTSSSPIPWQGPVPQPKEDRKGPPTGPPTLSSTRHGL